jgi:hypothetical protein
MDFVERWLGISPDGGNGIFEVIILASLAAALVIALVIRRRSHTNR